jgi:hypothetical protein
MKIENEYDISKVHIQYSRLSLRYSRFTWQKSFYIEKYYNGEKKFLNPSNLGLSQQQSVGR